MKTPEIGRVAVGTGEGIPETLLIEWWLLNLNPVVAAGSEGIVEGNDTQTLRSESVRTKKLR